MGQPDPPRWDSPPPHPLKGAMLWKSMSRKRNGCQTIGLPEHLQRRQFSLRPALLGFSVLFAHTDSADCWKLQLVTPSPHPPGHPTSDNSGRGGLASFLVFSTGSSLLRAHRRLAPRPRQTASQALPQSWRGRLLLEPHSLPSPVSITFFLLPIPGALGPQLCAATKASKTHSLAQWP